MTGGGPDSRVSPSVLGPCSIVNPVRVGGPCSIVNPVKGGGPEAKYWAEAHEPSEGRRPRSNGEAQ